MTLENALRTKQLDRTLAAMPAPGDPNMAPSVVSAANLLRSGFPAGQLSEIAGPQCSGRLTLALHALAHATCRGEWTAYIDTFDRLDVASAAAAGVAFDRLLWVRGQSTAPAGMPRDRTIDRALKALMLVLQAGGFGLVVLDLTDVPMVVLQRLPAPTWLRVQRVVEGRDTACVLLTPEPLARSAGGLTMQVKARTTWHGDVERSRVLTGLALEGRVRSPRRLFDGTVVMHADAAEPGSPFGSSLNVS